MTSEFFWDQYHAAIKERIAKHTKHIAQGKAENYEQYRKYTGMIAGLEESLTELKDCLKKAGVENDENS